MDDAVRDLPQGSAKRAGEICGAACILSIFFLGLRPFAAEGTPQPDSVPGVATVSGETFHVGLRTLDLRYRDPEGKVEKLRAAVWYPTEKVPRSFVYEAESDFQSLVAQDAPAAAKAGPCPLVVFAHGLYGSGYNSAYFAEYLARHGIVVAAPDYVDTAPPEYERPVSFSRIGEASSGRKGRVVAMAVRFVEQMNRDREALLKYISDRRLPQTSFVVDEMLKRNRTPSSPFYGTLNADAIGICGHSMGGVTAFGKIGAFPERSVKDDRIKAALVFSAPGHPFEATAKRIDVPLMIMAGDDDEPALGPWISRRAIYDAAPPPKHYLILKDATHFAFGNRGCGGLPLHRAVKEHAPTGAICRTGLAFFDKYLRGHSIRTLDAPDPVFAYYAKEEMPEETFEWGKEPPPGRGGPASIRTEFRKALQKRRNRIRGQGLH